MMNTTMTPQDTSFNSESTSSAVPQMLGKEMTDDKLKPFSGWRVHQPDSLLGMAASLFDVDSLARSMRLPETSISMQQRLNQAPARPEEITSQVLAELSGDLFEDTPSSDLFDSAELEPLPVNPERMNIVESLPTVTEQDSKSRYSVLEDTLAQVLNQEQNFNMTNMFREGKRDRTVQQQQSQPPVVPSSLQFQQLKRGISTISNTPENKPETPAFKKQRVSEEPEDESRRFRPYQAEQWTEKFEELCEFRKQKGHCCVPHTFKENPALARWVKRQRYQYKLKNEGKQSTMTDERVVALEKIGFIWDSHGAAWEDRLNELRDYRKSNGHCNVPSNFPSNPQLATWVKCQRRQYKLFWDGKTSNMTLARINELEKLGFEWELRGNKATSTTAAANNAWRV